MKTAPTDCAVYRSYRVPLFLLPRPLPLTPFSCSAGNAILSRMADDFDSDDTRSDEPPPPSLTRELFLEWRSPRPGTANPERMNNPIWEWLIQSRWNAWLINQHF